MKIKVKLELKSHQNNLRTQQLNLENKFMLLKVPNSCLLFFPYVDSSNVFLDFL